MGVGGITVSGEVFQRASHAVLCAGLYDGFSKIRCGPGVLTEAPVVHEILPVRGYVTYRRQIQIYPKAGKQAVFLMGVADYKIQSAFRIEFSGGKERRAAEFFAAADSDNGAAFLVHCDEGRR